MEGLFESLGGNLRSFQISLHLGKKGALAKETRITIETESLLIVHGRSAQRAWCPACAAEVEAIAMEQTGVISNLDPAALEDWLNSEELHRLETPEGSTQICLNSLVARVQKTQNQLTAAAQLRNEQRRRYEDRTAV